VAVVGSTYVAAAGMSSPVLWRAQGSLSDCFFKGSDCENVHWERAKKIFLGREAGRPSANDAWARSACASPGALFYEPASENSQVGQKKKVLTSRLDAGWTYAYQSALFVEAPMHSAT